MSLDIFLKVDGIQGEARDRTHANEIDVLSFTWGASNPGSGSSGGGGAGKVQFQTLNVVKRIDKASPAEALPGLRQRTTHQAVRPQRSQQERRRRFHVGQVVGLLDRCLHRHGLA